MRRKGALLPLSVTLSGAGVRKQPGTDDIYQAATDVDNQGTQESMGIG